MEEEGGAGVQRESTQIDGYQMVLHTRVGARARANTHTHTRARTLGAAV